jgi:hypothetical protein
MSKSGIPYFFTQYLLTPGVEVFVVEYSNDIRIENIIGRPLKAKYNKFLAILKQNQQCNLPQVGRLRVDSIFSFT